MGIGVASLSELTKRWADAGFAVGIEYADRWQPWEAEQGVYCGLGAGDGPCAGLISPSVTNDPDSRDCSRGQCFLTSDGEALVSGGALARGRADRRWLQGAANQPPRQRPPRSFSTG